MGVRVEGLGVGVRPGQHARCMGLGHTVWCEVQAAGVRVWGSGFRVDPSEHAHAVWVQNGGVRVGVLGCRVLGGGVRVEGLRFRCGG